MCRLSLWLRSPLALAVAALWASAAHAQPAPAGADQSYEHEDTRALVALVDDAAELVRTRGDAAFEALRKPGSRWREGEDYVFVLDPGGRMLVHPDPALEGQSQLELRDVAGKPIIRGLLEAATAHPEKPAGWYHYEWPVPGGLLPRWKSSYVRLVTVPSGARYVVGAGVYNDRMERAFVVDAVEDAAALVEARGEAAFDLFRDPKSRFIAKDAYVFVIDPKGVDLVNPAFPNLEGRSILDVKDTEGKALVREMLDVAQTRGAGWVDYMWPKPGDNVSTQKSAYVKKAKLGPSWVVVGAGVYLAGAPKAARPMTRMTAPELEALVREAAAVFEKQGEAAYPEFRQKGSKWFRDDTYFFVWSMDGERLFHAADPSGEGEPVRDLKDVLGRPFGRRFLETAKGPTGEGWVHYMYPEPGDIFPTWKSTFVKRITFPGGDERIVGSGVYHMPMERAFIEDVVNRAAALVAEKGKGAFAELRDKTSPFFFMDTYVFVDTPDGVELVNAAQPSLEGKDLSGTKDVRGKAVADEYIALAMEKGSGWVEYWWYKPGHNTETRKQTFVRKVESSGETFIVGSGFYPDENGPRRE